MGAACAILSALPEDSQQSRADNVTMLLFDTSQGGSTTSSNRNGYAPGGYTGLGLGLYLVKLSLQAMGSSVTVQSEVGRGTVFTFQLKLSDACSEEDMEVGP